MSKKLSFVNHYSILYFIAFIWLFAACDQTDKSKKVDKGFTSYVNAFTSGIMSNADPIIIELKEAQKVKSGDKASEDFFEFTPEIKGSAIWKDPFTLVYYPDEKLPSAKSFKAVFHLSKLMTLPKKYKDFTFSFQTKKQAIEVQMQGMQAYHSKNLTWNKLEGDLTTADFADSQKITEVLSATQNAKRKNITWQHNYEAKKHHFVIDSIFRGDKQSDVIVQWSGKPVGAEQEDEKVVNIPSINTFNVMNVELIGEPNQVIKIFFSDPINTKQNIKGLVRLKDNTPLRIAVSGNLIKCYPKKRVAKKTSLIVAQGIKNSMGKKMRKTFTKKIQFSSLKPNVKAISKGVIMPDSKGLIYPFQAVNLKAVNVKIIKIFEDNVPQFFQVNQFNGRRELARVGRVVFKKEVVLKSDKSIDYGKWNTFALDMKDMIEVDPGAVYRIEISFNKNQILYHCPLTKTDDDSDNFKSKDTSYDSPSNNDYYYDDYDYDYEYGNRKDPCKSSYYRSKKHQIKQNLLASNFGIIAKEDADHTLNVFISDLVSTKNLSGVEVFIYNYQQRLIGKSSTNADGQASFSLTGKPFLLVAKKDGQTGYLRLDNGSSLSLSMFNISGQKVRKGVKGYIYGDRGVWRPGDSIYLNFILEDKNNSLPKEHPVVMSLYSPDNQLYSRKILHTSVNNFYDFRTLTTQDAPTGNWLASFKVGGATFSKNLKIETVKPNRLKIKLDFNSKILHSDTHSGNLIAKWLHGAPASNLKGIVEMKLSQGHTTFKNYEAYNFDDASKRIYSESKTIFEAKLNANGEAKIPVNISIDDAPGMLRANFKTRVFENGGDFSIDRFSLLYAPYESYVGVKIPKGKGWNDALYSDETNLIPIVSLDEFGKPIDRKRIRIDVYEISWHWWWQRSSNEDLGRYIRSNSSSKILTDFISTHKGKAIYSLKFPKDTWGRKYIKITDPVSGHSTGKVFYTDYKGWWSNPDNAAPGGAEMLTFSTDKKKYNVGERVTINMPVSQQGKALISIENGSKMIESFWSDIAKDKHQVQFTVTKEMSPNVFVHISYVQPHNQSENDRPIRLYGVQGITVENPDSHLQPILDMADVLRPEKKVQIKVKEKDGKPMTYTIAVVDEGLLDLTHFKTPNPWNAFYAKEALGVKTYDMYNYIMGAFSGQIAGLLAVGGDEDLVKTGNKKANRFKPVVKFFGPFSLKKGEENKHAFVMPNYIGSVRTMVVAGDLKGAYGSTEKATAVKKPLMVLASLPRVLGPEENVKLPVTVFAMNSKIKDVSVKVQTNNLLQVNGSKVQQIHFDKEGEQMLYFDLAVARKVGIAKLKVEVSGGGEKATYDVEMNVRIANPELTHIVDGLVNHKESWSGTYSPLGIIGTNKVVLEVSTIPPINLEKRIDYLVRYPHGCIEQTTSSVFPQLYLGDLMDLSNIKKAEIQDNISQGLQRLKKFQLTNGGFTYWPGESGYANEWGTNYAGHFMLEAKKKGYSLPVGLLDDWIKYQRQRANAWSDAKSSHHYINRSNQMNQAYRLYTLALAGKPVLGAMNRMRESKDLYPAAKWRLIAAYELAGKKSVAINMMQNLSTKVDDYRSLSYTYGSGTRDEAMILETLIMMNKTSLVKPLLDQVAQGLSSEKWMNTQTTAYALLAVAKFVKMQSKENMKFKVQYPGGSKKINTDKPMVQVPLKFSSSGVSTVSVDSDVNSTLFVRVINSGTPLESNDLTFAKNLKMQIKYFDINGRPVEVANLKQGTDFIIEVNINHPGILKRYKNMALTQIFPSGWEITNPRMDNISRWSSDASTYQDVRDDRVMTYFDLKKYGHKTFRIMANASYLGTYYLPSVKCEAMYDNNIISVTNGRWVKVVK